MKFRYISWKLTSTHKHFGLMLLLGILAWAFAFLGKAQGLGYFPNVAAFMITVWVEYRQWSRSGKPFIVLLKERGIEVQTFSTEAAMQTYIEENELISKEEQ